MQISVIIISVLAIAMMAYGYNADKLKKFYDDFAMCNEKLGTSPTEPSAQAINCALINDGEILNANGEIITEIAMQKLDDLISDPDKLKQAREMHTKCYKEVVESGVTGNEQTLTMITCSMPIMGLIDKLK
ncbi:uncharacterized protein LOC116851939 [Odontomachus brunneus]|uniref:uncharacterized protein LOC116851939 n=1 Tax=Odontomachus brunneus TaxID=486640 RepID=UPI0013F1DE18|nr:uncharacterized protein LOC116851939 [Odontomachus brunneus]